MARSKFEDKDSGFPQLVKDDPYRLLFADCTTAEEVVQLQAEVDEAERS
jgi:hypothetical protein